MSYRDRHFPRDEDDNILEKFLFIVGFFTKLFKLYKGASENGIDRSVVL
jgi:hypothetical protein